MPLVPRPRVNLTRYHGVFAPNSKYRARVTPAKRGQGRKIKPLDESQDQTSAERRAAMTWAQRLKRVFDIDIENCSECGGDVRIIACIEDPGVIRKILSHLAEKVTPTGAGLLPESRAPQQLGYLPEGVKSIFSPSWLFLTGSGAVSVALARPVLLMFFTVGADVELQSGKRSKTS